MLASIKERIRRAFGPSPRALLVHLQHHLTDHCGGAVIGCRCGGLVVPVVNYKPYGLEIAALACVACHEVNGLDEPGLFAAPDAAALSEIAAAGAVLSGAADDAAPAPSAKTIH
jgi:hypothetical protein